jgi:hypothetical protein
MQMLKLLGKLGSRLPRLKLKEWEAIFEFFYDNMDAFERFFYENQDYIKDLEINT